MRPFICPVVTMCLLWSSCVAIDPDSDNDCVPDESEFECDPVNASVHGAYKWKSSMPDYCSNNIVAAAPEIIDGLDNDCDGNVDLADSDNVDFDGDLHPTPEDCDDSDTAIYPDAVETCDGKDNNCDGNTDEQFAGSGRVCIVPGAQGPCASGTSVCQNGVQECLTSDPALDTDTNQPEVKCDGVDNNCNGRTDENCECSPGSQQTCGVSDVGECVLAQQTCGADGTWQTCGSTDPTEEICDDLDNNCDGSIDEWFPEIGTQCVVPGKTGLCANGTYTRCDAGVLFCVQDVQASQELCNGQDDDCDGLTDEDLLQVGMPCVVPNQGGPCSEGKQVCDQEGSVWQYVCESTYVSTFDNNCNGIDDDCDGSTDEEGGNCNCFNFPDLVVSNLVTLSGDGETFGDDHGPRVTMTLRLSRFPSAIRVEASIKMVEVSSCAPDAIAGDTSGTGSNYVEYAIPNSAIYNPVASPIVEYDNMGQITELSTTATGLVYCDTTTNVIDIDPFTFPALPTDLSYVYSIRCQGDTDGNEVGPGGSSFCIISFNQLCFTPPADPETKKISIH